MTRMAAGLMMPLVLLGALSAAVAEAARTEEQPPMNFPQTTLASDALKLTLYLPDAEKGFYRATRFDWSGLVARAEVPAGASHAGGRFFGPFRPKHDPMGFDSVVGPAEEFDLEPSPPGYADAGPGDPFVKIGVGVLRRGPEPKYEFWRRYEFARRPEWKVASGDGWIEFRQDLKEGPWGCAYVKRIALAPGAAAFTITHTLGNTGAKPIDTLFYCHNFVVINDRPVGPDYRVAFRFEPRLEQLRGRAEARGRDLVFPEPVAGSVWTLLGGHKGTAQDNWVMVENRREGLAVVITGDQPVAEWRFYAEKTAACPEPFVRIQVAPGARKTWETSYTFTVTGPGGAAAPAAR